MFLHELNPFHKSVRNQDESCVLCTEEEIEDNESPGPLLEQVAKSQDFFSESFGKYL
jgi:hypothetical protein